MKKGVSYLLLLICLVVLTACSSIEVDRFNFKGATFRLQFTEGNKLHYLSTLDEFMTIEQLNNEYQVTYKSVTYNVAGDDSSYRIEFYGGYCEKTSINYSCRNETNKPIFEDAKQYAEPIGDLIIEEFISSGSGFQASYFFLGLFLFGIGLFMVKSPEKSYYLDEGWKHRNSEPSDFYIGMTQFGGVVMIITGIILFLIAIF